MTSTEMKQEFLILYDKITNFDAPGYEDIEISIFLTKGQERVVLSLYNPIVNRVREGFEETEARRKDLQELVKGVTISTPAISQVNALPNGVFFDLPNDFLYAISEEVTLNSNDPCLNNTRLRVKPITHDFYSINIANPWKKPSVKNAVWRLDYSNRKHELVTDGTYSIKQYHLRYIKKLNPIIIGNNIVDGVAGPTNCELNTILHKRIIDEAVKIATGITNPEQYQIKTIEQQKGEV